MLHNANHYQFFGAKANYNYFFAADGKKKSKSDSFYKPAEVESILAQIKPVSKFNLNDLAGITQCIFLDYFENTSQKDSDHSIISAPGNVDLGSSIKSICDLLSTGHVHIEMNQQFQQLFHQLALEETTASNGMLSVT